MVIVEFLDYSIGILISIWAALLDLACHLLIGVGVKVPVVVCFVLFIVVVVCGGGGSG